MARFVGFMLDFRRSVYRDEILPAYREKKIYENLLVEYKVDFCEINFQVLISQRINLFAKISHACIHIPSR